MNIDVEDLKVGYKFSTDARAKAASHLNSASHLLELISDATAILQSTKGTGRKRAQAFKVEIINLISDEKAGKAKAKKVIVLP